jgi:hypothetical protein
MGLVAWWRMIVAKEEIIPAISEQKDDFMPQRYENVFVIPSNFCKIVGFSKVCSLVCVCMRS